MPPNPIEVGCVGNALVLDGPGIDVTVGVLLVDQVTDEDLLDYVKNIYRVLLTRGIRGTYVYVVDPHLREYLRPFFSTTS